MASPRTQAHAGASPAKRARKRTQKAASNSASPQSAPGGKAKLVSSKLAFKGKVFNVFTETVIEPGGHKATRDVIRHNGSVVILAVDESVNPSDPDVVL